MRTVASNQVSCASAHAQFTQHFLKPHVPDVITLLSIPTGWRRYEIAVDMVEMMTSPHSMYRLIRVTIIYADNNIARLIKQRRLELESIFHIRTFRCMSAHHLFGALSR